MQHMFRTREVEVYMGLIWLLWQKKWKSHLLVKKSKNNFFLVNKGCFWCKMMRGIQKSWSQCSTMLTFWEIRSFLKKWPAEVCAKKQRNCLFQKSSNFAKNKRCRAWGPLFRIPPLTLHQKPPLLTRKKLFFIPLSLKWYSCHFRHNDQWSWYTWAGHSDKQRS